MTNTDRKTGKFISFTTESILLYTVIKWTLIKKLENKTDSSYINLLCNKHNISWKEHVTNVELCVTSHKHSKSSQPNDFTAAYIRNPLENDTGTKIHPHPHSAFIPTISPHYFSLSPLIPAAFIPSPHQSFSSPHYPHNIHSCTEFLWGLLVCYMSVSLFATSVHGETSSCPQYQHYIMNYS